MSCSTDNIEWTPIGLKSNNLLSNSTADLEEEEEDLTFPTSNQLFIEVELEDFELIKFGDTCLVSCLRNLTDVTKCQFVRSMR